MRLSISGTYSSGKTFTTMALSHYTGIPRSPAATIREILPKAVPGKTLAEVTPAEYIQLAVRRHVGRAVSEAALGANFLADGSSLQEWIYASLRVRFGMDPSTYVEGTPPPSTPEMAFFAAITEQLGVALRDHVRETFDGFVHLRNEFRLSTDGHRPMSEAFRRGCDEMLLSTLDDLRIPYVQVGGTVPKRLEAIAVAFELPVVSSTEDAVAHAAEDYARIDWRLENRRTTATASA